MVTTKYDLIRHEKGYHNGMACVKSANVAVATIVFLNRAGSSIDDIIRAYPYIPREEVQQALDYCADHREEIDRDIDVMSKPPAGTRQDLMAF